MQDALIIGAVRTPVGRREGALLAVHPVDLLATPLAELVARTGVDPGTNSTTTSQGASARSASSP